MSPIDEPFIKSTWFKSYWQLSARRFLDFSVYKEHQNLVIENTLRVSQTAVLTPGHSPEHICAYAVLEGKTLHWVYVRHDYRKLGIASGLLSNRGLEWHSHPPVGAASKRLLQSLHLKFNPYQVIQPRAAPSP